MHNPHRVNMRNSDFVINSGKIDDHDISKHGIIFLHYNLTIPKRKMKYVTYRNLKNIDVLSFRDDCLAIPWNNVTLLSSVGEKLDYLNNMIIELYDKHAPFRTCRITHKPRTKTMA
jgi:hypothetical protein